jgi:hypothetical protein
MATHNSRIAVLALVNEIKSNQPENALYAIPGSRHNTPRNLPTVLPAIYYRGRAFALWAGSTRSVKDDLFQQGVLT